jgi:hypothetical protein
VGAAGLAEIACIDARKEQRLAAEGPCPCKQFMDGHAFENG